jgi:hypothetical protein
MSAGMVLLARFPEVGPSRTPDRRPAAPGDRLCLFGHPARVIEGTAQQDLDLGVEAAELVGGPPSQGVMDGGVEAQRDLLALAAHV